MEFVGQVSNSGGWYVGEESDIAKRVLDVLDAHVVVLSADLGQVLLVNAAARKRFGARLPAAVTEAIALYVSARDQADHPPAAQRVSLGDVSMFLRVVRSPGRPAIEIASLHPEVLRDISAFRLLQKRHGVTRREYQVLTLLRIGKTNQQVASELGIGSDTVKMHVSRLLRRFEVINRTSLVNLIEQLVRRGRRD